MFTYTRWRSIESVWTPIPRFGAAVAILAASASAWSAQGYPKAIQDAVDAGLKVIKTFPAASGLTGWVLSQDGHYSVVFTTPDKKTLLAGTLIGENGESLSAQYEDKYLPKPDMAELFQNLEKSSYVVEGTTKNPKSVLYAFDDPNCPFCHKTWKALQPYETVGLQVRWIPIGLLGPTSMPKAIEVMASPDKTAAFRRMKENYGKNWTAPPQFLEESRPELAERIRKNAELMAAFGITGTPGLVWKDRQGNVKVKVGLPRSDEISQITGLPEQK